MYKPCLICLAVAGSMTVFLGGCGRSYDRIPFCWTSCHHLPPEERVISIDAPLEEVVKRVTDWVRSHSDANVAEVVPATNKIVIATDAKDKFKLAHPVMAERWASYNSNRYRPWPDSKWQDFVDLMREQVSEVPTHGPSRTIVATLNRRQAKSSYQVYTGSTMSSTPIYGGGFKVYSPTPTGIRTSTVPSWSMSIPTRIPTYETRYRIVDFYSRLHVTVFQEGQQVYVYAEAAPARESPATEASYGRYISPEYWKYVKGDAEAKLVRELLHYVSTGSGVEPREKGIL